MKEALIVMPAGDIMPFSRSVFRRILGLNFYSTSSRENVTPDLFTRHEMPVSREHFCFFTPLARYTSAVFLVTSPGFRRRLDVHLTRQHIVRHPVTATKPLVNLSVLLVLSTCQNSHKIEDNRFRLHSKVLTAAAGWE